MAPLLRLSLPTLLFAAQVTAAPLLPEEIPPALRPWTRWVLHGQESGELCPALPGEQGDDHPERRCEWPGQLALSLDGKGGQFRQPVQVYAKGVFPLPGDAQHWPQNVSVDGRPAAVLPGPDGRPTVELSPGSHDLGGSFLWDSLPEAVSIPVETGLLNLKVRGQEVPFPHREGDRVYLKSEARQANQENLELRVFRKITDEVPLRLETRVELNVSGKAREVLLGKVLPGHFLPLELNGPLPARLEPDGKLRVQVRAGQWVLTLLARSAGQISALTRPDPNGPWAAGDEIWVFEGRPALRQVILSGAPPIDPSQTSLPNEWKQLPAYAIPPKATLHFSEQRRGNADPGPDQLNLARTLWLDFDGQGLTAQDVITGNLQARGRLEMRVPTELGRVFAYGANQMITRLGEEKPVGVELQPGRLHLEAESRISHPSGPRLVPAVSWDKDFQSVRATLQLPPGWRLFHASGVDSASSTWVRSWTLLDLFLLLISSLAFGRLFGWGWGAVSFLALALAFPEEDAPKWVWLCALGTEALCRGLPDGTFKRLGQLVRAGAWAALLVIAVPFFIQQARVGMYPALEHPWQGVGIQQGTSLADALKGPPGAPLKMGRPNGSGGVASTAMERESESAQDAVAIPESPAPSPPERKLKSEYDAYVQKAQVQTGPGLPSWAWNAVSFAFSGPVERGQFLRLWLLSPGENLALALVRIGLVALLIFCLIRRPKALFSGFHFSPSVGTAAALLGALLLLPGRVRAEPEGSFPSPELLNELQKRLLEPPRCWPHCADSPRLSLEISPRLLRARMEVLSQAAAAIPLPGSAGQWEARQVLLDGHPAHAFRREESDQLFVLLPPGHHQLLLEGPLADRETVQLALPLKSHRVEAKVDGWALEGLHEDGLSDDALQLTRKHRDSGSTQAFQPESFAPLVEITRSLSLGLSWTVRTTARRLSESTSAALLEVPLLPGESVTDSQLRVQNGKAQINLTPGAREVSWTSVLPPNSPLSLTAQDTTAWVEVWQVDVSPLWHTQFSGIPVISPTGAPDSAISTFRPWPGESVKIEVVRPEAVAGQTLTLDQSELTLSPGLRATDAHLSLKLRASRGGQHAVLLPAGATLQKVTVNGWAQPIRQVGRTVALPLTPGAQSYELSFRLPSGIRSFWRTPEVDLGAPSVNAHLLVRAGEERWVLFTRGPRLGPSVLFWSFLFVLLLIGFSLGRLGWTPLRTGQWVLLLIGLSQVEVPMAALVVGWLLLLGWRKKQVEVGSGTAFNLRQIAIVGLSVVAFAVLIASIHHGLLGQPEMQISGNQSTAFALRWFQDRTYGPMPQGFILSVPMMVYRVAMLAWSLWLALALLRWVRWGWDALGTSGYWRSKPKLIPAPAHSRSPSE